MISGVVTILAGRTRRRPSGSSGNADRTETDRSRQRTQADEILGMLRSAGDRGCSNLELWSVAHAAHSRIADLRARGHRITCRKERAGVYRYVLEAETRQESAAQPAQQPVQQSRPAAPLIYARPLPLFDGLGGV